MLKMRFPFHSSVSLLKTCSRFVSRHSRPQAEPWALPLSQRIQFLTKPTIFTVVVSGIAVGFSKLITSSHDEKAIRRRIDAAIKWRNGSGNVFDLWTSYSPGVKLIYGIIAINSMIFLMWRAKPMSSYLQTYHVSSVFNSAPSLSMIGAMFSHQAPLHFLFNMYVLSSFANMLPDAGEAFQLYVTGGLMASLASYTRAVLLGVNGVSLGASGAILAVIGYTVAHHPEARFQIAFVSMIYPHSFTASQAFWGLVAFDSCGLILGWKTFDHAAHLGGILYGRLHAYLKEKMSAKK